MGASTGQSDTLVYAGDLLTVSCWCGIRHAVPAELRRHQLRQHQNGKEPFSIYCPLGHMYVPSGESEVERLRRVVRLESEERARLAAERDQAEASARAYKGAATRARKRATAATCPCCKRSFVQLRRHLATKHPEYTGAIK